MSAAEDEDAEQDKLPPSSDDELHIPVASSDPLDEDDDSYDSSGIVRYSLLSFISGNHLADHLLGR